MQKVLEKTGGIEHYVITKTSASEEVHNGIPLRFVLGYSTFLTWLFLLFWKPITLLVPPSPEILDYQTHAYRLIMLGSAVIALLLISAFRGSLFYSRQNRLILVAVALVFVLVYAVLPTSLASQFYTGLCAWIAAGIALAILLILWNRRLADFDYYRTLAIVTGSFVIAGVLFTTISLLQPIPFLAVAILLPLVSILLLFFEERKQSDEQETQTIESRKKTPSVFIRRNLFAIANNLVIGFVGCFATLASQQSLSIISIGVACIVAALVTYFLVFHQQVNLSQLAPHIFFLCATVALFCLAISKGVAQGFLVFLFFLLFASYSVLELATDSRSSMSERPMGPVPSTFNISGHLLGWGLGFIVLFIMDSEQIWFIIGCFLLVTLLAISAFLLFYRDSSKERVVLNGYSKSKEAVSTFEPSGTDSTIKTTLENPSSTKGFWKKACENIMDEYGLTTREREVFHYLARGRNVQYMQKELFLSQHTVKSHIYNIYSKLGVHSHQDLLDLIEKEERN